MTERRTPWEGATPSNIDSEVLQQLNEREKRRRAEQREKRPRATYDIPRPIIDQIIEISEEENIPRSDIVVWALIEFIKKYESGEINFEPHKVFSNSLRFQWALDLPETSFLTK